MRELLYLKLKECTEQRFGDATVFNFFVLFSVAFAVSYFPSAFRGSVFECR